jgi:uncharacterized protein (TIGR02145 family)
MKALINSLKRTHWFKVLMALFICLSFLIPPSCQKDESDQSSIPNMDSMSPSALSKKDKLGMVKDVDGNWYKTVAIGTQVWMAENLKTTRFNDKTKIPNVMDFNQGTNPTTPGYCWYDYNAKYKKPYGALYNWYAVDIESNGSKNICPTDWHVPTNVEWTTLTDYLTNNGYGYEGDGDDIAKSMASTSGWNTDPTAGNVGNDQASNNSSGFTALPGGYRFAAGTFTNVGFYGIWWSATEYNAASAWSRTITSYSSYVTRSNYSEKPYGFSVRCIKDN